MLPALFCWLEFQHPTQAPTRYLASDGLQPESNPSCTHHQLQPTTHGTNPSCSSYTWPISVRKTMPKRRHHGVFWYNPFHIQPDVFYGLSPMSFRKICCEDPNRFPSIYSAFTPMTFQKSQQNNVTFPQWLSIHLQCLVPNDFPKITRSYFGLSPTTFHRIGAKHSHFEPYHHSITLHSKEFCSLYVKTNSSCNCYVVGGNNFSLVLLPYPSYHPIFLYS